VSDLVPRGLSHLSRADRQYSRELAAVDHQVDVADAVVAGIAEVTQHALVTLIQTSAIRRTLEHMFPDSADLANMLVVTGTVKQAQQVEAMGVRRGCGR
jgi:hypothetical protein